MFSMNLISTVFWAFIINYLLIQSFEYNYMIILFLIGLLFIMLGNIIFNYRERIIIVIED